MTIIVKICGLTSPEGLEAALSCGADMVGFVVFAQSHRHVSLKLAAELGRRNHAAAQGASGRHCRSRPARPGTGICPTSR